MGRFRTIALMLLYWTSDRETLSCATGSGADQSRAKGGGAARTNLRDNERGGRSKVSAPTVDINTFQ